MKAVRLLALAAALLCSAGLISKPAAAAGMSATWSDLWHTPDQQGQSLLDAGQPAQAASRFQDPRRRAYADLQAGRYQEAVKLLAPFADAESEYNRGNALAKAGQLQAALAAYDAALKQSPADKDIRHNRDLVERELRQQQSSQSSRKGQQGGQGGKSSAQQQARSGQQSGTGSQQSGSGQTASNGSQGTAGQQGNSGGQSPGQGAASPQGSAGPQQSDGAQSAGNSGSGASKEAPGQAQRDAAEAAALARQQRQGGNSGNAAQAQAQARGSERSDAFKAGQSQGGKPSGTGSLLGGGGTQTPKQKPESERQLALDQWLRQIPDSPAGLLQRKFLIEHMMKQQDSGDPQSSGP